MKITAVRSITGGIPIPGGGFAPAWWPGQVIRDLWFTLCVIETDAGITGFGPGGFRTGGWSGEAFIRKHLLGRDPRNLDIGALAEHPESLPMAKGNRPVALEFALWDLLGKACGQPVYRMLGGYKDAIKAYCSTGSVTDAGSHIDFAHNAIERGYRAIKLRMHRATVDDDLAVVRAVRDAVGDRLEIMADANQAQNPYWTRADALRAARGLQELGVSWLEEPLAMHDAEGLATVAGAVDMPIAGAENEYGMPRYAEFLKRGALDILQPDLEGCGGLLEWRKIAAVCEAYRAPCLGHVWNNGLVVVVALHASCSVPNAPYLEVTDDPFWPARERDLIMAEPLRVTDGMVQVPTGPGWGIELNWDVVRAHTTSEAVVRI